MKYEYMKESEQMLQYFQFPKFLLKLRISQTAKFLYMILYDRARISRMNSWIDKYGNVDHQLQYVGNKGKYIEKTKTDAGTRVLPMSEEVYEVIKRVLANRKKPKIEICIDGYTGFLFLDKRGKPMMPYQWEKRFQHSVEKYNKIYRVQLPKITPHVCRHTFCTNMAKRGISVETLKYLMGHTDISVTLNVYTHLKLEDAEKEIKRLENIEKELKRCAR